MSTQPAGGCARGSRQGNVEPPSHKKGAVPIAAPSSPDDPMVVETAFVPHLPRRGEIFTRSPRLFVVEILATLESCPLLHLGHAVQPRSRISSHEDSAHAGRHGSRAVPGGR